jgi:hypothetical protein
MKIGFSPRCSSRGLAFILPLLGFDFQARGDEDSGRGGTTRGGLPVEGAPPFPQP